MAGQADLTVVIPTYNRLCFLLQAINSCFDGNEGVDTEVIVVDDGSTDGTVDYFAGSSDLRVRLLQQEHQGPQMARNLGLANATGRYIKFLDDDDWLPKGALQKEMRFLNASGADISSGDLVEVDEYGRQLLYLPGARESDILPELLMGRVTTNPLRFTIRLELARKEKWNPKLRIKQDVDYFLRVCAKAGSHVRIPGNVGIVRRHGTPRVSAAEGYDGALKQLAVLIEVIRDMAASDVELSEARLTSAKEGVWHWIHICAIADWKACREAWNFMESLCEVPFLPSRSSRILKVLDFLFGPWQTEALLLLPRKARRQVRIAWGRAFKGVTRKTVK